VKALLGNFYREYMRGALPMKVPRDAVRMLVNSTEVVLYREAPFQVELITLRKSSVVPPHSHPNIDTYELLLSGSEQATVQVGRRCHGRAKAVKIVSIHRGVVHSAQQGPDCDTAFLSFQYWHGIAPTFITDDWLGGKWV
jgi:quercetin dioxygenase-like cupin family protein